MKKQILKFHTGRGGQFHNPGHVRFVGFERIDEGDTMNDIFYEDISKLYNGAGRLLDAVINKDGTGYIDEDGQYDTTTCVFEDKLNQKQVKALTRAYEGKAGLYWEGNSDIETILQNY